MRWVKEIFPPRFRLRKLLITIRLSAISLAGTARTEVAVGTSSEDVMSFTTAAATPRNVVVVRPSPSASCAARAAFAALAATMSSGVAVVVGRAGRATGGAVSVDSLPPTRAGVADGAAASGLVDLLGSADPGCFTGAGPGAAALWRVGGGGGGGLAGGRVELVIVGAVFADAVGGKGRWSAVVAPAQIGR